MTHRKKILPKVPVSVPSASTRHSSFSIVCIGASAGGLEAFQSFFEAMPADSGMAFVLVSHLDPTHPSILPELIQKATKMQVLQAADNMQVKPNHVYVIPPNKEMAILNGCLQLMELLKPRASNLPIDIFFRSLALDLKNLAIFIIHSGTGTDGTLGRKAINGEVGMVMVQDEASAKYDGMPRNTVATGLVDYVLPPAKMPEQLLKYASFAIQPSPIYDRNENLQAGLQRIFILLRSTTGHDFSLYKINTICRRIERRMHVHQLEDVSRYIRYLQESERELHTIH